MSRSRIMALLPLLALAACSDSGSTGASSAPPAATFDPAVLQLGGARYAQHCAQCHGPDAQGHPDWQTPSDGTFTAAPPLDDSGNVKHRSKPELTATIKGGVRKDGLDIMPAWGGRLSDTEIDAVIAWFQSLWSPDTFAAWQRANALAPGAIASDNTAAGNAARPPAAGPK